MIISGLRARARFPAGAALPAGFYVAPTGSNTNAGTAESPWSLAYAVTGAGGAITPGSVVWLRGGVYVGDFFPNTNLSGTTLAPVVWRSFPGERAKIDGGLRIKSANSWWWNIELFHSSTDRLGDSSNPPYGLPRVDATTGLNIEAANVKFIHTNVHDEANGLFAGVLAPDLELYGGYWWNNGWVGPERAHGHNMYLQNLTGQKIVRDNVNFNSFFAGIQLYGSNAPLNNFVMEGNAIFGSGESAAPAYTTQGNVICYNNNEGAPFSNHEWRFNSLYHRLVTGGGSVGIGVQGRPATQGSNLLFEDNISRGRVSLAEFTGYNIRRNTISVGNSSTAMAIYLRLQTGQPYSAHSFDHNRYNFPLGHPNPTTLQIGPSNPAVLTFSQWQSIAGYDANGSVVNGVLPGTDVIIRPSAYEPGRALVHVWNWSGAVSVNIDLSSVLDFGDTFTLHHVFDDVVDGPPTVMGTFTGSPVPVTMLVRVPPTPIGWSTPADMNNDFGVFTLRKTN